MLLKRAKGMIAISGHGTTPDVLTYCETHICACAQKATSSAFVVAEVAQVSIALVCALVKVISPVLALQVNTPEILDGSTSPLGLKTGFGYMVTELSELTLIATDVVF